MGGSDTGDAGGGGDGPDNMYALAPVVDMFITSSGSNPVVYFVVLLRRPDIKTGYRFPNITHIMSQGNDNNWAKIIGVKGTVILNI